MCGSGRKNTWFFFTLFGTTNFPRMVIGIVQLLSMTIEKIWPKNVESFDLGTHSKGITKSASRNHFFNVVYTYSDIGNIFVCLSTNCLRD